MSLHTARGHLTEPPIAKCLNARQDWMEMQLHSTVVNGESAARGDSIPALNIVFSCKGRSWTCSPHPFLQQNGLHVILRKLPKPKVALLHAIFLLISKVADSRAPVLECSLHWVLLMAPVHSSSVPAGNEQWMCNHICTRGSSASLSTSVCLTNRSKFTIRNARQSKAPFPNSTWKLMFPGYSPGSSDREDEARLVFEQQILKCFHVHCATVRVTGTNWTHRVACAASIDNAPDRLHEISASNSF